MALEFSGMEVHPHPEEALALARMKALGFRPYTRKDELKEIL